MAIILSGKEGKIAERVIIVGNLGRMKTITSMLNELETVNEFAGYYTYTGEYNGKRITVNFHGIGNSSLALITNDLINLGAKYIVRFGSATGVSDKADVGTAVVPIGYSYNIGGFALQELGEMINFAASGNLDLINLLVDNLKKSGVKVATGNMFTSDSIHSHDEKFLQKWRSLNHLAIDLEGAALYFEGARHGISTGAVHLIYRNPMTGKSMSQADIERTEKEISKSILDALTKL